MAPTLKAGSIPVVEQAGVDALNLYAVLLRGGHLADLERDVHVLLVAEGLPFPGA